MNILNTYTTTSYDHIFYGIIIVLLGLVLLVKAIDFFTYNEIISGIFLSILAIGVIILSIIIFKRGPISYNYIECSFTDSYSMPINEYTNYEFIEQRGDIYKFRLINND